LSSSEVTTVVVVVLGATVVVVVLGATVVVVSDGAVVLVSAAAFGATSLSAVDPPAAHADATTPRTIMAMVKVFLTRRLPVDRSNVVVIGTSLVEIEPATVPARRRCSERAFRLASELTVDLLKN
jgi:hypothetical protein